MGLTCLARISAIALAGAVLLAAGAADAGVDGKRDAGRHTVAKKARKPPETPKAETPAPVPVKPSENEDFTYALKNVVKAKSSAFCDRYGGSGDCIEDIEICLTMLDRDDDTVRVCLTTTPSDADKPRSAKASIGR